MSQYKINPLYDLKDLKLPKLWGRPMKVLAHLLNSSYANPVVKRQLLKDGGIESLREVQLDQAPVMMPKPDSRTDITPSDARDSITQFCARMNEEQNGTSGFYHSFRDFAVDYRTGKSSPTTVANRLIETLKAQKETINAITNFDEQDILHQARESEKRLREGTPRSPLEGVPVSVKDEVDATPYPTSVGTQVYGKDGPAQEDATVVARMRAAGCIIIGKANMHEIGIGVNGYNPHFGVCRNPYHLQHATGGSSSGSAAAVAAGIGPLSLGADGGGSIRIPAALCGQVGLKATWSRISEHGAAPLCWSVAHLGPIGANVDDVAMAYLTMAGPDPKDSWSLDQPELNMIGYGNSDLSGFKTGIYHPWFEHATPDIVDACRTAVGHLIEHGATEQEIFIDKLEAQRVAHAVTISSEMLTAVEREYLKTPMKFATTTRIGLGFASAFRSTDYVKAQRVRAFAIEEFNRVFKEVDVIITPTTAVTAPGINNKSLPQGESDLASMTQLMRFVTATNLTGFPSITLPVGYDEKGLPVGLQITGRAWEEHILLRMAKVIEGHINKKKPTVLYDILR
ncbi:MAG: amidase [Gammaproteobacteria bacterium]|nr:MAG: amidase [Pseudomonadota bacterium]PIE38619.1 MAG: amidase [Gammaproteobacteria bacterium]